MSTQEQTIANLMSALQRIANHATCAPNDDEEKAGEAFTLIMKMAQMAIAKAQEATNAT